MATLDTLSAEQHADLGIQSLYVKWDYAAAKEHLERALVMDPGIARAQAHYAWYLQLEDRLDESVEHMKKAHAAEPQNPLWAAWVGWACEEPADTYCMEEWAEKAFGILPDFPVAQHVMGLAHMANAEEEAAAEWFQRSSRDSSFMSNEALALAITGKTMEAKQSAAALIEKNVPWNLPGLIMVYIRLDEPEQAISTLQQAFENRHPYMPWLRQWQVLEPILDDPRVVEIFEKVGMPGKG